MAPPPAEEAQRFHHHAARALALAESALRVRPSDPDAHFSLGSIVGIQASYGATVEGRVLASFRSAKRAFDEHERVLKLAPYRKDAGLVVGTYRYFVAALSLPMRLMAYVAGFGGGRERGLRMVEEAAASNGETEAEAKFALLLLYNRERRFHDAMRVVHELQRRFPRNRLLWLEGGATLIRALQYEAAVAMLDEGFRKLEGDGRERMFGEVSLWHYKRAVAQARLGRAAQARADLAAALAGQARDWVRGRAHAELGRLAEAAGQREQAHAEYRLAIELAERGNDPVGKQEAQHLLRR
jgi:tetratricopeptide (TPR) repeat protein